MPALLTRMSIFPWRAMTSSATSLTYAVYGDVEQHDLGIVALGAHGVAALLGDGRVDIGDDHLGAGFRQRLDASKADGAAAAGDKGGAAGED